MVVSCLCREKNRQRGRGNPQQERLFLLLQTAGIHTACFPVTVTEENSGEKAIALLILHSISMVVFSRDWNGDLDQLLNSYKEYID